jgi:hypothetical protein
MYTRPGSRLPMAGLPLLVAPPIPRMNFLLLFTLLA